MPSRRDQYKGPGERAAEQEQKAKENEAKERAQRLQDSADLKDLLDSKQSRRYLKSLFKRTGYFLISKASSNAENNEEKGRREIGEMVLKDIEEAAPEYLYDFIGESFNERRK